jgi:hypothetical protein
MDDYHKLDAQAFTMKSTNPKYILHKVLAPVQSCFGSVTRCQEMVIGDDNVLEMVEHLLPDLKKEGKPRSMALQKLYMFTDSKHESNR